MNSLWFSVSHVLFVCVCVCVCVSMCCVLCGGGQDPRKMEKQDDGCGRLAQLLREPLFLTSMVHTLEEQKSFTIQHKCVDC